MTLKGHILLKNKLFMTLLKKGKADFIQDHFHRCGDNCSGFMQWGREIGLNFKYKEKGFRVKEQGGVSKWIINKTKD